jgi:sirohydrochlorin cobaltochelatase
MTHPLTGTLLILSGTRAAEDHHPCSELAQVLAVRLGRPVVVCHAAGPGEPVAVGIRTLVASGVQRLVLVPLVLSAEQNPGKVPLAIQWASRRWPFLTFHGAAPLDWQEWANCLTEAGLDGCRRLAAGPRQIGVLLAGAGGPDPLTNANLARLAQLVRDADTFARVDHAFLDLGRPRVPEAAQALARLGLRDIVVVPWLLAAGDARLRLPDQVGQAAREHGLHATLAATALAQPALIEILLSHYHAALADNSFLAPSWAEIQAEIARSIGPATHVPGQADAAEEAQLRELDQKINDLLPPEYQGRYEQVAARSMGTAPLQLGPDGRVAWDAMWTRFCDLALAGGPPHRGTLLEAVPAADALGEPEKYPAVVAEIERGIRLVTGLPIVPSKTPGWVGVRCDAEAMAIWLMRAIIVENVMVRREGDVIYLPAGPHFMLKREIKNVVTVVAKTCHYWTAHQAARRRLGENPAVPSAGDISARPSGGS